MIYYLLVAIWLAAGSVTAEPFFLPPLFAEFRDLEQSKEQLTNVELTRVNSAVGQFLQEDKSLTDVDKQLVHPYLANAQRAFNLLSKQVSGKAIGSFKPITVDVIHLFHPEAHVINSPDNYSNQLSAPIGALIKAKLIKQKSLLHPYPLKTGEQYWYPSPDYVGLDFGTLIPWYLSSVDEFRAPAPSAEDSFWQEQVAQVKAAMQSLDKEKLEAIHYWADKGNWVEIADSYMQQKETPLDKRLMVRAVLSNALMDAKAAVFDSKYTYWVKRPFMRDASIQSIIAAPSHPSYPAGHAAIGKTAAVVLSYFFPENQEVWEKLAWQCSISRLWAGIHFPIDLDEGAKMGEKVGLKAIKRDN